MRLRPFRDRGQGLCASRYRAGGEGEGLAPPLVSARVGQHGQAGEQTGVLPGCGRSGSGELAQAGGNARR